MNVEWLIPCRFIEIHDNLATMVGAGIDTFHVVEFPAQLSVSIAVRLAAAAEEMGPEHRHRIRSVITAPDGSVLSEVEGEMEVGTLGDVEQPEWLQSIMLSTLVQFEATGPGTFTFEHIVDGSSAQVPLHVVAATED